MDEQSKQVIQVAGVDRREFLRMLGITAVAAAATGSGAAVLARQAIASPEVANPVVVDLPELPVGQSAEELLAQLALSRAENRRLQVALEVAQQRGEAYHSASAEVAQLRAELDRANKQVSVLVGLVALYEQMDQVDVGTVWQTGLTAVSNSLAALLADIPWLQQGVATGRQVLQDVEAHIPLLQNGRAWADNHLARLRRAYDNVKILLEAAVSASAPFLEMLRSWFQDILKWLPFGLGERASQVMDSLAGLLGEIPYTLSGLDTHVVQPLAVWLADEEGETALKRRVIRPLQRDVLDQAEGMAEKAAQLQQTYAAQLVQEMQTAVTRQQYLRAQISTYRQQHNL